MANDWLCYYTELFLRFVESKRSNSIFHSVCTVASSTMVVYDWGVQDNVYPSQKKILMSPFVCPALTFGQEVGWGDSWTEVHISLKIALQVELIWVGRVAHEMNYRLICWTWCRGNAGPLWLSYISLCVIYAFMSLTGVYWLQDMLGALPCNTIHRVCSRG